MATPTNQHFKVPFALVGPLWAIIASLAGIWYSGEQAKKDSAVEAVALRKDVAELVRNVAALNIQSYPRREAEKESAMFSAQIQNLGDRVYALERKGKK